jgi:RNA polymerase sigma factor (sigma-70 family)
MSDPKADPVPVSEADYKKAEELIVEYIDEYDRTIYWHLVCTYGAREVIVQDVMQQLWLHVFQQLTLKRHDKMFKSYLFNKARWICSDLLAKDNRLIMPVASYWSAMKSEDEIEEEREAAGNKMVMQRFEEDRSSPDFITNSRYPEALSDDEEAQLFQRFWANYPEVDLTQEQKEIAFELFREGRTLKEISEKRGIPISTLSDWKAKITDEVETAHHNQDAEEAIK